ncbi:hypothetical protein JQ581_31050 [Bradyrhizobium liaoningense]|uniref:hypothetical protein n=1 Tax=Bradyrhizobium liaoningense TaxID=43992 RepID=UPI001BAD651D|nr:hypothetical protein [Bradyrhizobium liaoningense]MBR0741378.1 hypothetical protein [Bradyrhizobium liaoningense]
MSQDVPLVPRVRSGGSARKGTPKRSNALKHGAFSSIDLLPWENAKEFETLRRELFVKYNPDGPLQKECMLSIASLMWRKRRIQRKREFDIAAELERTENSVLWKHPMPLCDARDDWLKQQLIVAFDAGQAKSSIRVSEDYDQLFSFSCSLYRETTATILRLMICMLPDEFKQHLLSTCAEASYEATSHWVVALKKEVDSVLLPMIRRRHPGPASGGSFEAASRVMNEERLLLDLAAEERIERNIDQLLGRFFKLKMADEVAAHKKSSQPRLLERSLDSGQDQG